MSGQDRVQTRGIRIVVLAVVVGRGVGWRVRGGKRRRRKRKREGWKEYNDSDSDDGGGSFREITGFNGVRLTGASTG